MNSFKSDRRKPASQSLNQPSTFVPAPPATEHDAPAQQGRGNVGAGYSLADLSIHSPRPAAMQLQQSERVDSQEQPESASQGQQANQTGLPDTLKAGVERLSGYSLDNIRVHYNSPAPAEVQALAYTQGTEIHMGPGQEQHLAHEAWHVVQQMQGRVQPTMQMKGMAINDDEGLEREADVMGEKAASEAEKAPMRNNVRVLKQLNQKEGHPTQLFAIQVIQNPASASGLVIQRKGTQITWDNSKNIRTIEVAARPDGPEGAHTTSWAVIVQGLREALHGNDFVAALTELWKLTNRITSLPFYGQGPQWLNKQLDNVIATLLTDINNAAAAPPPELQMTQTVQELADRYLYARNLVPGTIDSSRGSKNTGEKKHADAMVELTAAYTDMSYDSSYEPATVKEFAEACFKSFDVPVAPKTADERGRIIGQHMQTIISSYPGIYPLHEKITKGFIAEVSKNWGMGAKQIETEAKPFLIYS